MCPGTKSGGIKARNTNYVKHGKDFYKKIGAKGGAKKGVIKGFAANRELARTAGAKGGRISRRGPATETLAPKPTPKPEPEPTTVERKTFLQKVFGR